jgi:cholesterol transport system auxiliary component
MMTEQSPNRIPGPTTRVVIALVATVLVAGGCSLTRPAPIKQAFLIDGGAPPVAANAHPATLRVGTINVAAPFRGRALVFRQTDLRYEADFYSEFLVAPAAMLGEGTARALDRARVFARVVPPGAPPDGEFVLDGFVDALFIDVRDAGKPTAEVAVTYYLLRAESALPVPFWSKQYRRSVPVAGSTPDAYAAALSAAFGDITAELARDLAALQLPQS